jgi:hypothetical protein
VASTEDVKSAMLICSISFSARYDSIFPQGGSHGQEEDCEEEKSGEVSEEGSDQKARRRSHRGNQEESGQAKGSQKEEKSEKQKGLTQRLSRQASRERLDGRASLLASTSQLKLLQWNNIAGLRVAIKMKFRISGVELRQYILNPALHGRMIRTIASDELLDNGLECGGRQ